MWLASASDARAVSPLAETVGAAGCLASDGRTNLAGEAKAAALAARFGERGFDYIGNERRDLAVWKRARRAIGVGLGAGLARKVRALDGAAAGSVALSPWLLAFFLFLFLALAIVKRQGELRGVQPVRLRRPGLCCRRRSRSWRRWGRRAASLRW